MPEIVDSSRGSGGGAGRSGINQHDLDDDFDATTLHHSIAAFMFGRALNAKDVLKRPTCFMRLGVSSALS